MSGKLRKIIYPAGVMRAVHVLTPALVNRLQNGGDEPLMAVRSSSSKFTKLRMFRLVEMVGGTSKLAETFDKPMPGTSGRGVAIVFTDAKLVCYADGPAPVIDTPDSDDIQTVYAKCQAAWKAREQQLSAAA